MLPLCANAHARGLRVSGGVRWRTARSGVTASADCAPAERSLDVRHILFPLFTLTLPLAPVMLHAQVTTATLYGVVRDATAASVPGALITVVNQGTGQSREIVTDATGEFAVTALPTGRYTLKIELQGFKTYTNDGLDLAAGQTVRQTFTIEVGQLAENITVSERAPLVETASAAQKESHLATEVQGLPLARRNITSLLTLAPGVSEASTGIAGGGNIRLNGVAEGGTAITVDGTDATANNETRGINSYGAQNQISVMSIEAVAEVQVVKGILPAEYGGSVGGQVNMLTRSGANVFHGSLLENWQGDKLTARNPFLPAAQAKPPVRFNQFGGTLGGAVIRNRLFFFTAFEGYRENVGVPLTGTVPTQQLRDRILTALPNPETKIVLDVIPLPTEAINADFGCYVTAGQRTRSDNTFLGKTDVVVNNGNLSVTFSRMRPETVNPSIFIGSGNDQRFLNQQDLGRSVCPGGLQLDVGNAHRVESQRTGPAERLLADDRSAIERRVRSDRPGAARRDVHPDGGLRHANRRGLGDARPVLELRAEVQSHRVVAHPQDVIPLGARRREQDQPAEPELQFPVDQRPSGERAQLHESPVGSAAARRASGQLRRLRAGRLAREQTPGAESGDATRFLSGVQGRGDQRSAG